MASRLVNTYGVPALLFTIDGDEPAAPDARGNELSRRWNRSRPRSASRPRARGRHHPHQNLKARPTSRRLYAEAEAALPSADRVGRAREPDELTLESVALVERLAPFGQENPQPTFLARNVTLVNTRAVGQTKDHFACTLTNGRASVAGIMFHCAAIDALLVNDAVVDAAFTVQIDEWRGAAR
ncbi:MAG: hypothetical protein ACLUE1_01705 [Adlercreutzia equolifaciens]